MPCDANGRNMLGPTMLRVGQQCFICLQGPLVSVSLTRTLSYFAIKTKSFRHQNSFIYYTDDGILTETCALLTPYFH